MLFCIDAENVCNGVLGDEVRYGDKGSGVEVGDEVQSRRRLLAVARRAMAGASNSESAEINERCETAMHPPVQDPATAIKRCKHPVTILHSRPFTFASVFSVNSKTMSFPTHRNTVGELSRPGT